jgi:putative nucleotidyltransferase with HDIG domain
MHLENARAFQTLRRRAEQSQHLIEVSRDIAKSLDVEQVLQSIMRRAVELLSAESGSLFLIDEPTGELIFRVVEGPASEKLLGTRLPLGVGIVGVTAQEGKPFIVNNAQADPRHYTLVDKDTTLTTRSVVSVPLIDKDQVIGVIQVLNKTDGTLFDEADCDVLNAFAIQGAIALGNAQLYSELRRSFADTVRIIANAVEARDPYLAGHTNRVTQIALALADELGWSRERLDILEIGAILHDIGKIGIPDNVLNKPEDLTLKEYNEMKKHPVVGAQMLRGIAALKPMLPYILYHQERYDGKGYPFGLKSNEIPIEGRLLAVADTFDAMTSTRPYRDGLSQAQAVEEIVSRRGTQFDPEVVDALLAACAKGRIQAIVQAHADASPVTD